MGEYIISSDKQEIVNLEESAPLFEHTSLDWRYKKFSHIERTVRLATCFSGIGAIEHAFKRLKIKHEIIFAGDNYLGKNSFPALWIERMKMVEACPDIISFKIKDQTQIDGPRGYVNSDDYAYELIRELSLPLVSYISVMEIADNKGNISFYWKLFVDFDIIAERKNGPLVLTYGKSSEEQQNEEQKSKGNTKQYEIRNARVGQGKYREKLLEECPFCPITMVNDERLLIASHIKPWVVSNDREKIDPHNGYILTPLYDKLFDKGFITFTDDKHMLVSDWLSPKNCQRLALVNNTYYPRLPMDEFRIEYLEYHRKFVFKG